MSPLIPAAGEAGCMKIPQLGPCLLKLSPAGDAGVLCSWAASPGEALRSQRRLSSNIDVSRLGAEPDPEPGGWGGGWKL